MKLVETAFGFENFRGTPERCLLRLYSNEGRYVAVLIMVPAWGGGSVYNSAETLAEQVARQYGLDPERTIWIHHMPPPVAIHRLCQEPPDYQRVTFQVVRDIKGFRCLDPKWRTIPLGEYHALISGHRPRRNPKPK